MLKRFERRTYRLYKSGATYGALGIGSEAEEIKNRLQKRGFNVRITSNIWGNTYIWIRKK